MVQLVLLVDAIDFFYVFLQIQLSENSLIALDSSQSSFAGRRDMGEHFFLIPFTECYEVFEKIF